MTATSCQHPPPHRHRTEPDPARTGAVWVTGTGAFLLLAAAAVFVAVRWADIPPSVKLGAIGALTGAFLLGGRRLRPTLPATAGALFHLGAFLVPVDIAAIAVHADLAWAQTLLVEGMVCAVTFGLAARAERSVVLRWAAVGAVVAAAAGAGAVGPVPAPVVLATGAVAALLAGHQLPAVMWAAVAGLAPAAGLALGAANLAPGVLERLGLAAATTPGAAAATGIATAAVLATAARRRLDPAVALLAVACLVTGAGVTGVELEASAWAGVVGASAVLALVEVAALLLARDRFWDRPAAAAAAVAEVLAVPGTLCAAAVVLVSPWTVAESAPGSAALALLAVTWLAADLRRRNGSGTPAGVALLLGGRFAPATVGVGVCAPAAVALATGSGPLTAAALLATGAVLAAGGRPLAPAVAVLATTLAPLTAVADRASDVFGSEPVPAPTSAVLLTAALTGLAGSLLLARMASWRATLPGAAWRGCASGWSVAATAPLPVTVAALVVGGEVGHPGPVLVVTALALWLVATAADTPLSRSARASEQPATATRAVAVAVALAGCGTVDPWSAVAVAGLTSGLVVSDALRRDDPRLGLGLAASVPVGVVAACIAAALTTPRSGVALAVAAVVTAGLGSVAPRRWHAAALATTGSLAAVGLVLAATEQAALADALLVTGGLLVGAGLLTGRLDVAVAGGAATTLGAWSRLADAGVGASEPYVAPVAVVLLLAGLRHRDDAASSWVTTGPAIALLGGAALVERLAGGPGVHALVAGAVGVAAVAGGGARRLAAPLVLGTGLLVALAGHESLAVTAGVPTWGWLALGGTILLGTGIGLERSQVGPLQTGRRLVDTLQERYR